MSVQRVLERGCQCGDEEDRRERDRAADCRPDTAREVLGAGLRLIILRGAMIATALGAALVLSVAAVSGVRAAYVVTFLEVGPDVVATGGGSLDLAGLLKQRDRHSGVAGVAASIGAEITGPASSTPFDQYVGATGPTSYGEGGLFEADAGSGNIVGVQGGTRDPSEGGVAVPSGYRSGDPLSEASIYRDQTFATLGILEGTYIYRFGAGPSADTFTVQIGPAVPEPTSWALLAVGFASLGFARCLFCRRLRLDVLPAVLDLRRHSPARQLIFDVDSS
jgi:hypothetical protein